MTKDVVIDVQNLSKCYRIAHKGPRSNTLRDSLAEGFRNLGRRFRPGAAEALATPSEEDFWALRDVSFQVGCGEVLGLIGRNGAGKSTVLKLLSRITEPTTGRIGLRGRVASLLEVGTGFHPELTGRENIFLNGAILGMKRAEIRRKFDEIVAFAEIEKFLDTPVKRYSSGMYVRLAFAVAAHLEPEILIVDEVLAVGDTAFQSKCLGKIGRIATSGRTVLFVSHNMSAISSLCSRALLLERGSIMVDGLAREAIDRYMLHSAPQSRVELHQATNRNGPGKYARFQEIALTNSNGQLTETFAMGDKLIVDFVLRCKQPMKNAELGLALTNRMGTPIHYFVSTWEGLHSDLEVGTQTFRVVIPELRVHPGTYCLTPWVKQQGFQVDDEVEPAVSFAVLGADLTGYNPYFERYTFRNTEVYCPSVWALIEHSSFADSR